jgi:hypothetical protein
MASHLQCPVPYLTQAGRLFLYVTARDAENRSHPFRMELDAGNPTQVIGIDPAPLLELGGPGTFDSRGIMPSCACLAPDGSLFLYYIGWNVPSDAPFRNAIGLAVSRDDGMSFAKVGPGPVLDRNLHDPLYVATPEVHRDGDTYRMWYLSGAAWQRDGESLLSCYHIKHAHSPDGVHFATSGHVCIPYREPEERAVARPAVMRSGEGWMMWFCARRERYIIVSAASRDGIDWVRDPVPALLPTGRTGDFDGEQTAYPALCRVGDRLFMFYNGDRFGQTGIGLVEATV